MVNIYKLEFTTLQQEIFRFLCLKAGKGFNLRGLARATEVSSPAISKALPLLEKRELIKVKKNKESGRFFIELNRDNPKVIALKRIENLRMIYESGIYHFLSKEFPGVTLILFGSFSHGEDTLSSDIDIAVIGKKKEIGLDEFKKIFDRTISLHFYPDLKKIDKNLKENILNGIVLKGGVEL